MLDSWQHRVNAIEIGDRIEECRRAARRLRLVIDGTAQSSRDIAYSVRPAVWTSRTAETRRDDLYDIARFLEEIEQQVRNRADDLENLVLELDALESIEWRRYHIAVEAEEAAESPAAVPDLGAIESWLGAAS